MDHMMPLSEARSNHNEGFRTIDSSSTAVISPYNKQALTEAVPTLREAGLLP